jgi:hypothetical protein
LHTDAELWVMVHDERVAAMEFDKKRKKLHTGVEYSFNRQVTKFPHIDD